MSATTKPSRRVRQLLVIASGLALLWVVVLILLAVFTANPVTLNQDQIKRSPLIITATVINLENSTVLVEKEWRRGDLSGKIVVQNLGETTAQPQQKYIMPLSVVQNDSGRFRVTESLVPVSAARPQKMRPLIYPANDEAIEQLQQMLASPSEHRDR